MIPSIARFIHVRKQYITEYLNYVELRPTLM